jgi:two-component system response regulator ResD
MEKILVVDDEQRIRKLLRMYLEREPFVVSEAENGEEALKMALEQEYDLIILDVMMPGIDGIEVCTELRKHRMTPVLFLTAKGEETNRVHGFEAGGDDYVVKPFSPREVIHRIRAILRRVASIEAPSAVIKQPKKAIIFPNLVIDDDAHLVTVAGVHVNLTPKEYDLLHYLAVSVDKAFSREQLLRDVWHYDYYGDLRTVDTHVKRLREKLNNIDPSVGARIVTVWGVGYKMHGEL